MGTGSGKASGGIRVGICEGEGRRGGTGKERRGGDILSTQRGRRLEKGAREGNCIGIWGVSLWGSHKDWKAREGRHGETGGKGEKIRDKVR